MATETVGVCHLLEELWNQHTRSSDAESLPTGQVSPRNRP